jgi:hypothetical protein
VAVDSLDPGGSLFASLDDDAQDSRPSYNPQAFVADVVAMLRAIGIRTNPNASVHTAAIAAADLLRALGVRPSNVPDAPPKKRRP